MQLANEFENLLFFVSRCKSPSPIGSLIMGARRLLAKTGYFFVFGPNRVSYSTPFKDPETAEKKAKKKGEGKNEKAIHLLS